MFKYILFTGATGGLGEVCVQALSKGGRWKIFAAGTNKERLNRLQSLENVIPLPMDITSRESVLKAREAVAQYTDRLDAIANFAGVSAFTSMVEGDCLEATERVLAINVTGVMRVNRVFFEMIQRGHGRIVNCSSEAGWMTSQPFAGPYFLSKRAVEAYNDSLRRELMFLNIPVIKIQPGSFPTNITKTILDGFEKTQAETLYYKEVLGRLKPMMMQELRHNNDPGRLAAVVIKALEARRPRLRYRVGTGKLLLMMELLPESWVDWLYKKLLSLLPMPRI